MASAAYRGLEGISPALNARRKAGEIEAGPVHRSRRSKARARLLGQTALSLVCLLLLYQSLSSLMGPAFIPYRIRIGELMLLFVVVPLLIGKWLNWVYALRGIAELGIVGSLSKTELANVTARRAAMRDELRDSKSYIDVMHDQIGDSLAESER